MTICAKAVQSQCSLRCVDALSIPGGRLECFDGDFTFERCCAPRHVSVGPEAGLHAKTHNFIWQESLGILLSSVLEAFVGFLAVEDNALGPFGANSGRKTSCSCDGRARAFLMYWSLWCEARTAACQNSWMS